MCFEFPISNNSQFQGIKAHCQHNEVKRGKARNKVNHSLCPLPIMVQSSLLDFKGEVGDCKRKDSFKQA